MFKVKKLNSKRTEAVTHLQYCASHELLFAAFASGFIEVWHYETKRSFTHLGAVSCGGGGAIVSMSARVKTEVVELIVVSCGQSFCVPLDVFLKPYQQWSAVLKVRREKWGKDRMLIHRGKECGLAGLDGRETRLVCAGEEDKLWTASAFNGQVSVGATVRGRFVVKKPKITCARVLHSVEETTIRCERS